LSINKTSDRFRKAVSPSEAYTQPQQTKSPSIQVREGLKSIVVSSKTPNQRSELLPIINKSNFKYSSIGGGR
jgi:hypothetical protein